MVKDGFDLAVRIGKLKESNLKVKKIGEVVLILVASPAYLKKNGNIKAPQELKQRECLALAPGLAEEWKLKTKNQSASVAITPRVICNQMSSLLNMAKHGGGIALVPGFLAQEDIDSGRLVRVLTDWAAPGLPVSMLSPLATTSSARLKISAEELFQAIHLALSQLNQGK